MKWYLMGTNDAYYIWFRNPYELESGIVYQITDTSTPPQSAAGYYNLEWLMKTKSIKTITPPKAN